MVLRYYSRESRTGAVSRFLVSCFFLLSMSYPAPGNFTRFYVLTATRDNELPPSPCPVPSQTRCLVRLSPRGDLGPAITQLLTALAMNVSRFDRRPQLESSGPFHDVYFAELERGDSGSPWASDIEDGIERVRASGGEAELLGIW
jgi:prephenate dehydratase